MPTRSILVPSLLAVTALAAGCGGSSGGSGSGGSGSSSSSTTASTSSMRSSGGYGGYGRSGGGGSTTKTTSTGARAIKTAKAAGLGTFLVDSKGMALYLFEKDKGPTSTCYSACAKFWPPVTTSGKPAAMGSLPASELSTTKRKDGSRQVLYGGHPLYYYAPDAPGTTLGQGVTTFGAPWYVLTPGGKPIQGSATS